MFTWNINSSFASSKFTEERITQDTSTIHQTGYRLAVGDGPTTASAMLPRSETSIATVRRAPCRPLSFQVERVRRRQA